MKKDEVIKELEELCLKYIGMARSSEDPSEKEWAYGKADGVTEAIDIIRRIYEKEVLK